MRKKLIQKILKFVIKYNITVRLHMNGLTHLDLDKNYNISNAYTSNKSS